MGKGAVGLNVHALGEPAISPAPDSGGTADP